MSFQWKGPKRRRETDASFQRSGHVGGAAGGLVRTAAAQFQSAMGGNASGNELGNARPRHESFGASFVLHAAQVPGGLKSIRRPNGVSPFPGRAPCLLHGAHCGPAGHRAYDWLVANPQPSPKPATEANMIRDSAAKARMPLKCRVG